MLGLALIDRDEHSARLGPDPRAPALVLSDIAAPTPLPPGATGLYHVAWLHPDRAALAESVRRVAASRWPFEGASDHGVSEALYLSDPDGLGIELYADRPRERWERAADGHGVRMVTLPLDLDDLLAQFTDDPAPAVASGHERRARPPEGLGRAACGSVLPRRARPGGTGAAALRGVPRRRRLSPSRGPQFVAEPGRRRRPRQRAGAAAASSSSSATQAALDALERTLADAETASPATSPRAAPKAS